jgi:outer membrane protein insertion porin family
MRIQSSLLLTALWAAPAFAQAPVAPAPIVPAAPAANTPSTLTSAGNLSVCSGHQEVPPPVDPQTKRELLPPAGSAPIIYTAVVCFPKQGNVSLIESQTYLYYMQVSDLVSLPSQNLWKPYNEAAEQTIIGDHKRLWATNFLDDLKIEAVDFPFSNGVIGKVIVYEMEERQRIKNTVYNEGTKEIEQAKVEERLRELGITVRLDSFVDQATEKKVANVIREMMVEKGFQEAKVEPYHEALPGGPKTIALKFKITEGPKIKISSVDFVGNTVFSDRKIRGRMKTNKGGGFWIFPGSSVYQEDKFEEDAEAVVAFYRDRGYLQINVGQPTLKPLRDSKDGKERFMTLEIPISEGQRFRVAKFEFAGNDKVPADVMRPLFKMKTGDYYNEKRIREGFQKIQEIYGTGGHFEMTPYPEFVPEGDKVNVTIRINEGKQYFINRITFEGNTTTRDSVIRRELRLYENSVYNTEALKYSVKRLNQLGYFKPLEDQKNITTQKTPGTDNKVDVTLKLEEQNRNQLSFGAGVSQYDGVFGQLSFSTANFMGRGETFTVSMQTGARVSDYQVAFTEPFLFDRPITGSIDVHRRDIEYLYQFTQGSTGGNITMGFPMANFSRMYVNYSYDRVYVRDLNQAFFDRGECLFSAEGCQTIDFDKLTPEQRQIIEFSPYLKDALLIGQGGRRTISKITPTFSLNSIDNPITPTSGTRYTASLGLAGIGGNTRYANPTIEGTWFLRHTAKTSLGLRAQAEYIRSFDSSSPLPIFERLVLGGGYSVRGYDLRSIGPQDPGSGIVIGGNKSLLFNAEYLIAVGGPVRLILFYDAGQVQDSGNRFTFKGRTDADGVFTPGFVTSTGAEIRFFMPVLNVPFRLIFASNPQRKGVLNYSTGQPEKAFRFRFDVGSTF